MKFLLFDLYKKEPSLALGFGCWERHPRGKKKLTIELRNLLPAVKWSFAIAIICSFDQIFMKYKR
ncbi:hypothetical protein DKE48_001015 [Acinetobacter nosocomialis]|nr:hypothetical protein DKE48_001015 [Acinetobacter nosocomialis]